MSDKEIRRNCTSLFNATAGSDMPSMLSSARMIPGLPVKSHYDVYEILINAKTAQYYSPGWAWETVSETPSQVKREAQPSYAVLPDGALMQVINTRVYSDAPPHPRRGLTLGLEPPIYWAVFFCFPSLYG